MSALRVIFSLLALCSPALAAKHYETKKPTSVRSSGMTSVAIDSRAKLPSLVQLDSSEAAAVSQRQKEGMVLSAAFEQAALELPSDSPTRNLLRSFRICGTCHKFQRLGEPHDGGYLTCMDHLQDGHIKAAYSFGVEQHDKFSSDVVNTLHIPVNQLDCTVSEAPVGCSDCHFFQKCIKGSTGQGDAFLGRSWDLKEIFSNTGMADAPERSLLLKMDIEAGEWPLLNDESDASENLKKFQQIIIEFHWLDKTENHPMYLAAMQKLFSAGFQVVHIHGNDFAGEVQAGGFHMPDVVEVTFESQAEARPTCNAHQEYLTGDTPNNPWGGKELPMAELPN